MTSGSVRKAAAAMALGLVFAGTAAAQGLYWEATTTGKNTKPQNSQFWAMPKMLKIAGATGEIVIVRSDSGAVTMIDTKGKTYREVTPAELAAGANAMRDQAQTAMAKVEEQLKNAPPEQRAMMEKMLANMKVLASTKPRAVKVDKTKETKTIAGRTCTKYVATADGKPMLTAWTTTEVPEFVALRPDWVSYQRRMAEATGGIGADLVQAYNEIDGFPMETEMNGDRSIVTKIEARNTPATEFDVPAGFTKTEIPLPKGGAPAAPAPAR